MGVQDGYGDSFVQRLIVLENKNVRFITGAKLRKT